MKKKVILLSLVIFIIAIIPLSSIISSDKAQTGKYIVNNGVMDLKDWDYKSEKTVKLDGEWEFYWNQLLTPEDYQTREKINPNLFGYMKVPVQWNGRNFNGSTLPVYGCATYRAVLKNVPQDIFYGIKKQISGFPAGFL